MINESRLLNEANSFFTQRKFEKALELHKKGCNSMYVFVLKGY